jgi:hypothetical protein
MLEVVKYSSELKEDWDRFIDVSKNSSFLLKRAYMEYHADRFEDVSIMVYCDRKIVTVFPANKRAGAIVGSHDGLTYGGFVFGKDIKLPMALAAISEVFEFYARNDNHTLEVKVIPRFYHTYPSDEVDYAMFLCGAELYRRDTALVVDQDARVKYSGNYRREANQARKKGFTVREEPDLGPFWDEILSPNLHSRFGVRPVHSKEEIVYLKSSFSESIKCYTVRNAEGEMLCGTVFYLSGNVAHAQYIASTDSGRRSGALNLLFIELMDNILDGFKYFDFGISNENQGRSLNQGLLSWKERMGGRTIVHDFYRVDTNSAHLIRAAI